MRSTQPQAWLHYALLLSTLVFSAPSWALSTVEAQKILASDGAAGDQFGFSVAISGDTAVIGSFGDDDNGSSSGSATVFTRTGSTWTQQAKFLPSDGAANDRFGWSVAVYGDTVLIGSYQDDDNGPNSGSATVFTRTGSTWTQQAKLLPSDGAASDNFGFSVAVNGDTALIGSHGDDDNGSFSGSATVFTRTGSTWTQQAKLTPGDGAASDRFGYSVAIVGDTAVIGSYQDDDNGPSSGSATVFTRTGSTWTQQAKLLPSDGATVDLFGLSVAIAGDTALIGSFADDDNGSDSGSAYTFDLSCAASTLVLPNNTWRMIGLPCALPTNANTVSAVFGDEGMGNYSTDWALFSYDVTTNAYNELVLSDVLVQGQGYWIIQASGNAITAQLPAGSLPSPVDTNRSDAACISAKGCLGTEISTLASGEQLQLLGNAFAGTVAGSDLRVKTTGATGPNDCSAAAGCSIAEANASDVLHSLLWTYDGSGYTDAGAASGTLQAWDGFWAKSKASSFGTAPKLLVPQP